MRKYSSNQIKCDLKEAQLLYSKLDLKRAKFLLKNSIETFETQLIQCDNAKHSLQSKTSVLKNLNHFINALGFYSNLLDETKSENPSVIIKDYLEKSIHYIKKYEASIARVNTSNTYFQFAKFSDMQYQNITEFLNSTSFEEHRELMKKLEAEKLRVQVVEPSNYLRVILSKQHDIDQDEIKQMLTDQENYLCKAIENYLEYLVVDTDASDGSKSSQSQSESVKNELKSKSQQQVFATFRLISLWTQNSKNPKVNQTIKEKVFKISTYKFHTLMHQLSARMSLKSLNNSPKAAGLKLNNEHDPDSLFQSILIQLIINVAKDHYYHVLPLLFAFSNSHKDYLMANNNGNQNHTNAKSTGSRAKKNSVNSESAEENDVKNFLMTEDRVNTANYILNELKLKSEKLRSVIESMSLLCEAYIVNIFERLFYLLCFKIIHGHV